MDAFLSWLTSFGHSIGQAGPVGIGVIGCPIGPKMAS